jgi:hypothetical protein
MPAAEIPTEEHVLAVAPDATSVTAARKLTAPRNWASTGRSERAAR